MPEHAYVRDGDGLDDHNGSRAAPRRRSPSAGWSRTSTRSQAVRGVEFEVATGEVFGFLGPNGAGKTTTINMLCTLAKPTAG